MNLLAARLPRSYVSVRADQAGEPLRARYPQVIDRLAGVGPIAGILAAQEQEPAAAWLVLACDLPLLDDGTLAHLIAHRDAAALATAYRSSHDGLPEPLCAIWEPGSHPALAAYLAQGRDCPRKFLIRNGARLLDEPNPRALDNVNTPLEYGTIGRQHG